MSEPESRTLPASARAVVVGGGIVGSSLAGWPCELGWRDLRVVDASVFPYVTNGNIYAPVMMAAEKAADLIRGLTPLPPAEAPFYRHNAREPDAEPAADR